MCPEELLYTKEHEWVRVDDAVAVIGITEYAQDQLGDVVYVELPEVGTQVEQFARCGSIESVKTVSDLYAPISGEVVNINDALNEQPELVNNEPYGSGWVAEIQVRDTQELDNLLSASEYEKLIQT
jgi:glycine cleavage system H protein